jgi:hypothetical protein
MRSLIALLLLCLSTPLFAQQDSLATDSAEEEDEVPLLFRPDNTVKWKMGVRLGGGISSLVGQEIDHPSALYSVNGAMYVRRRYENHFMLQAELGVSTRGSDFNNDTGQIQRIRLNYIDLPLLLCYGLNKTRNSNIVFGVQYSFLINSLLFVNLNPPFPESGEPHLSRHDFGLVGGFQFYTPFVGFQLLGKYGLTDINRGLTPTVKPVSRGLNIRNIGFEINFLF